MNFKTNLSSVEIEGLEAMFNEFYSEYIGIENNHDFKFFWCSETLNSEDDANGYPLDFEGYEISHLAMLENGLTYIVCYENDKEIVFEFNCYNDNFILLEA